ncbi:hypothetical protein AVEN_198659-1 [Araneus ventricosus]|uniref:Uncharacterized protein n=1 Tax=Araneus ventricosus TaxID=182803 RepID=A0A4Y2L6Q5_ARAVE|nr:hypothetical protein AVEN_198659-1 [Araneus ventricosus]
MNVKELTHYVATGFQNCGEKASIFEAHAPIAALRRRANPTSRNRRGVCQYRRRPRRLAVVQNYEKRMPIKNRSFPLKHLLISTDHKSQMNYSDQPRHADSTWMTRPPRKLIGHCGPLIAALSRAVHATTPQTKLRPTLTTDYKIMNS